MYVPTIWLPIQKAFNTSRTGFSEQIDNNPLERDGEISGTRICVPGYVYTCIEELIARQGNSPGFQESKTSQNMTSTYISVTGLADRTP